MPRIVAKKEMKKEYLQAAVNEELRKKVEARIRELDPNDTGEVTTSSYIRRLIMADLENKILK